MSNFISEILFQEEECFYPYVVHSDKYSNYQCLLIKLAKLKGEKMCDFKYDSIFHPLKMHCVHIKWNLSCDMLELKSSVLISLLQLVESVLINSISGEWQLSLSIYKEKEVVA